MLRLEGTGKMGNEGWDVMGREAIPSTYIPTLRNACISIARSGHHREMVGERAWQ
jgi:hypothetical protein